MCESFGMDESSWHKLESGVIGEEKYAEMRWYGHERGMPEEVSKGKI